MGGLNRYAYANGNPINNIDNEGLAIPVVVWGAAAVASVAYARCVGTCAAFAGIAIGADIISSSWTGKCIDWGDMADQAIEAVKICLQDCLNPVNWLWGKSKKIGKKAKKKMGPECFVAGTLIHTIDGMVAIENIQVGDLVAAKDEKTGDITWKSVIKLYKNENTVIFNVTLEDETGKTEALGVSEEHPFWVEGEGWVGAGELEDGDVISSLDGRVLVVKSVIIDEERQTTYNFEVEDYHSYFVGEVGAWVHNVCEKLDTSRFNKNGGGKNAKHKNAKARAKAEKDWNDAKKELEDAKRRGASKKEKEKIKERIKHKKEKWMKLVRITL